MGARINPPEAGERDHVNLEAALTKTDNDSPVGVQAVSLALQGGGESRRMGMNKALAPFPGGTLLEWVRDRSAPHFGHPFLVANDPVLFRGFGLPLVTDALDFRGSAVGVYTAVLASPTERVLCLACDMPFVTPRLLRRLAEGSAGYDVYVPRHGEFLQPLCAVYSKRTLPELERLFKRGERRIDLIYPEVRTGYLDVSDGSLGDPDHLFRNVNTPEELQAAAREAARDLSGPGLARHIREFMNRTPIPTVSFVGKKKSGKTTVLEGVVREMASRGHRLAVIKHDTHGFDVDIPGTDSYRLREAGAVVTGISSPDQYVWLNNSRSDLSLEALVASITEPVDMVLTEGFKTQSAPKVEISRKARSTTLICDDEELLAVVSDQDHPGHAAPRLDMDDFEGIADLLEERILGQRAWTSRAEAGR